MDLLPYTISCPYCGEPQEVELDLSGGSQRYVEDCQVCCRPIEFAVDVDAAGELAGLDLRRDDD